MPFPSSAPGRNMPFPSSASVHSRAHTSSTMNSIGNQIGSKVRTIAHYGQPTIDINLRGARGNSSFIVSYSTMDAVEGEVVITAPHDTRFEDLDIAFTGTSTTFVDRLTTAPTLTGRTEAAHRFLCLRQPIDESDFPAPRIFEAGKQYRFPFTFTIPSQLLPKSCQRDVVSSHVREMHLQLPPSLGDAELAGFGTGLLDDLAPEMSKIVYCIKVRIVQQRGTEGLSILAEKAKKVRVKPAFEEQPPLNIDNSPDYRPRQEKTIKKGLFKGKLGTLAAKTIQPKPLVIPGARSTDNQPINTMAKIVLRFDPTAEDSIPPKLGSLETKLKIQTWYASAPRVNFPTRSSLGYDLTQGVYSESVNLSTLCIAAAQWEKHDASESISAQPPARRDSGISDCSLGESNKDFAAGMLSATSGYQGGSFYTAQILVPVTLPLTKNFIPTFHQCLISRVYTLGLSFAAHGGSRISLKIPIQICAEGSSTGIENARARSVEETELREATAMFRPRSIAPPAFEDQTGRSASLGGGTNTRDELPPDYAAFAPPSRYVVRTSY